MYALEIMACDIEVFYLFISDIARGARWALRVFDVIPGVGQQAALHLNVFAVPDHDRYDYIDMLAYGRQLYWSPPYEETTRSCWERRDIPLANQIRYFRQVDGGGDLSFHPEAETHPQFAPFKHCHPHDKSVQRLGIFMV